MWGEGSEFSFDIFRDVGERVNELSEVKRRDMRAGTGERFDGLVRFGVADATQNGLDGFRDDDKVVLEILMDDIAADGEFGETTFERGEG